MLSTLKTSDDKEADINYSIDYCDQQSTGLVIKRRRCRVAPYAHTFSTCAKARWLGCKVIDVLSNEFGAYPLQYWTTAILNGFVRVNGSITNPDHVFKNNDKLTHKTHRHEASVFGEVVIVGQTENLVAVNKPSSLPMQPCGGYRYNSLEYMLRFDAALKSHLIGSSNPLHIVHRLDRVTSGLVVLAKSKEAAADISKSIRDKKTVKVYLARVKGDFRESITDLPRLPSIDFQAFEVDETEGVVNMTLHSKAMKSSKKKRKNEFIASDLTSNSILSSQSTTAATTTATTTTATTTTTTTTTSTTISSPPTATKISANGVVDSPPLPIGYCIGPAELSRNRGSTQSGGDGSSTVTTAPEADCGQGVWIQYPTGITNHRDGLYSCDAVGDKPSLSHFRKVWYCPLTDTSLVECRPYTGRTHQLRLHLQLCGYPIANDPFYGGDQFFLCEDQVRATAQDAVEKMRTGEVTPLTKLPMLEAVKGPCVALTQRKGDLNLLGETEDEKLIRMCRYCEQETVREELERILQCDEIWLHSLRYSTDEWDFETPYPAWANRTIEPTRLYQPDLT